MTPIDYKTFDFSKVQVEPPPKVDRSNSVWRLNRASADTDADQAYRRAMFDKIAPKDNWKMPINTTIDEKDFEECYEAAIWFTGGGIEITRRYKNGKVRVQGAGYYVHIGA